MKLLNNYSNSCSCSGISEDFETDAAGIGNILPNAQRENGAAANIFHTNAIGRFLRKVAVHTSGS